MKSSTENTTEDKLTALTLAVFKVNGLLVEWGDDLCRPYGLSSARWQVLGAISLAPQTPNSPQIASAMGMTRQGVQKQINLLIKGGLIRAIPNPGNKRSPLFELTPQGRQTYQILLQNWQERSRKLSEKITVAELNTAMRVLSILGNSHPRSTNIHEDKP